MSSAKPFRTTLSEEMLKKAFSDMGEDEQRRRQVIDIITKWMAQQPHLQRIRLGNTRKREKSRFVSCPVIIAIRNLVSRNNLINYFLKSFYHFNTDEYSVICFARGCKYSLEKIKFKLDLHFTLRTALPEFFTGWDPMKPRLQDALACG